MPNPIKYSTGSETDALRKGNFHIGTGSVGKGPSDTTGYYQAVSPPSGGYVIYLNNPSATSDMSYHIANNDSELISFTNSLAEQSYTGVNECLVYYAGQTDKVCLNRDYEGIVTDGLVFSLDAGFTPSYPKSNTTWYDLSGEGNNGTLINAPTFSTNGGGSIVFDGVDDFVNLGDIPELELSQFTVSIWCYPNSMSSSGAGRIVVGYTDVQSWTYGYAMWFYPYFNQGLQINSHVGSGQGTQYLAALTPENNWYQFVTTFDGTTHKFYVNNILKGSISDSVAYANSNVLRIGNGYNNPYRGNVSITQIYNRALTADEVLQNYNATKGRFGL